MSSREVGINIALMGKYRKMFLSVCFAPLILFALSPSVSAANAGGSCSRPDAISGTISNPLVCKKVNGKLKWTSAPGGSCKSLGAMSGTVSKPWVCQKVGGKLRWVELTQSSTTTTTASKTVNVPSTTPNANTTNTTVSPNSTNQIKVTTTTIPCPTGTFSHLVGTFSQTMSPFPDTSNPGYLWYSFMRYLGSVTNNTSSTILVKVTVTFRSSPPWTYGSPLTTNYAFAGYGSGVPPGQTVPVQLSFTGPSLTVPTIESVSVTMAMWDTAQLVAFCPAPTMS